MRSKVDPGKRNERLKSARVLIQKALDPRTPVEERRSSAVAACLLIDHYGLLARPRPEGLRLVTPPSDPPRTPDSA